VAVLAPATSASATDCTAAERLAKVDLDAARMAYLALLDVDVPPACAAQGFGEVARMRATVAGLLVEAQDAAARGDTLAAVNAVAAVRRLDPANGAAHAVLDGLVTPSPTPTPSASAYAGPDALYDAGYHEEAREEARKVAVASGVPIPSRYDKSHESRVTAVEGWTEIATKLLAALGVAFGLIVVLIALATKLAGGVARRRAVTLGTFATVEGEAADAGAQVKTVVAEEMAEAARSTESFRVVDAAAVDLPDLVSLPDQFKAVTVVTQFLFRRPLLTISATARGLDGSGWQVTAQVADRRKVVAQETFAVPAAAGPGVKPLGVWIAMWAMFAVHENTGWRWPRETYRFGTKRWVSAAWMRLAVAPDVIPAVRIERLHRALLTDHRNVVALAWLGAWQTGQAADPLAVHSGLEHLRLAERTLETRPTRRYRLVRGTRRRRHFQIEPLWFQIAYARTIAYLHRYAVYGCASDLVTGTDLAMDLARRIAATSLTLSGWWRRFGIQRTRRQELRAMLDRDHEYHLGVLAGALASAYEPKPLQPVQPPRRTGRTFWKWVAAHLAAKPDPRELLGVVTWSTAGRVDADTAYNLACVWAQAGNPRASFASLRTAFEHQVGRSLEGMLLDAETDPTLNPLKGDPEYGSRCAELIATMRARLLAPRPADGVPAGAHEQWTVEVLVS
jgi:hypothetical protein